MRSPPADLAAELVASAVAGYWGLRSAALAYVPEGGGGHHWRLDGDDGRAWFVTVDDLDGKEWLGGTSEAVFGGLGRALATAAALRHRAGLEFVLAPVADRDGELLRRLGGGRYAVSVFPFVGGRSFPFGPYPDERLRGAALDLIAALHRATPAVRDVAPRHVLGFEGRAGLDAFLAGPARPWDGGPFAATAHGLLRAQATDLARFVAAFGRLAAATAPARAADPVITHGEPHPANLLQTAAAASACAADPASAHGEPHPVNLLPGATAPARAADPVITHGEPLPANLLLIDWDTAGLGPPERDLALVLGEAGEGVDRYRQVAGREPDPAVLTLYRARWYLDDLASAVRLFSRPHAVTPDTQRWFGGLAPRLAQLATWRDRLD
jgi:spectinomycin phosphotransferase